MRGENLAARLPDPPNWLGDFVAYLAERNGPARACTTITALGRLLDDEHPNSPQALLERARRPGRSMGPLARGLEGFFTERGLALPTDHTAQLAAGRRQRRIDAVPEPLRPQVAAFNQRMLHARDRARRASTRPRTDRTIEAALATMRDSRGPRPKRSGSSVGAADLVGRAEWSADIRAPDLAIGRSGPAWPDPVRPV